MLDNFDIKAPASDMGSIYDRTVRLDHALSEPKLDAYIRDKNILPTPEGIALSLLLVTFVSVRFQSWKNQSQSEWLRNNVHDASEDITVSLVCQDLKTQYDNWLDIPFRKLGKRLIKRFVVRQHEVLAYDKSHSGGKILFHTENDRIIGRGIPYEKVGAKNARFSSAIQIILDLGWMQKEEGGILELTNVGLEFLKNEIALMEKR